MRKSLKKNNNGVKFYIMCSLFLSLFLINLFPSVSYAGYSCEQYYTLMTQKLQFINYCYVTNPNIEECFVQAHATYDSQMSDQLCRSTPYNSCQNSFANDENQCETLFNTINDECKSILSNNYPWNALFDAIGAVFSDNWFTLSIDVAEILLDENKYNEQVNSYNSCEDYLLNINTACEVAALNERARCTLNTNAAIIGIVQYQLN
jgi:hypothetical protein